MQSMRLGEATCSPDQVMPPIKALSCADAAIGKSMRALTLALCCRSSWVRSQISAPSPGNGFSRATRPGQVSPSRQGRKGRKGFSLIPFRPLMQVIILNPRPILLIWPVC